MKEIRSLLRDILTETISGFIVAIITSLALGTITGQWQLAVLIGCVSLGVIAGLAYLWRKGVLEWI